MRLYPLGLWLADSFILTYVLAFFALHLALLAVAFFRIRNALRELHVRSEVKLPREFLPSITLLVPAYNEAVTIEESLKSLFVLDYPKYEIVICNDGSKDETVAVLRRAFPFEPIDIEDHQHLPTQPIVGVFECRHSLPDRVRRLVLIDKKNGGKADALNACINVAAGDYIVSMDADTILEPDALLRAIAPVVMGHGKVVAVGGQIALCNGASVSSGRILSMGIPKKWIARFQLVEYMRSFALGRTALSAFHSVLILSGAFALMRRDLIVTIGGFLTKTMRSRVGLEYCGPEPHTVCEDMEIIVRLHRYLLDRNMPGEVVSLPFPVAWTEAPESYVSLGKQRARWFRGLAEVLMLHRHMMFRKKYTHIGWFALPYQFFFEFLAPLLEFLGYVLLLITMSSGILSVRALLVSILFSQMVHVCLSTTSVLLSIYTERGSNSVFGAVSLFPFRDLRSIFLLLFVSIASNIGYRQYLIFWQLRGLIDFLRRKRGWDKFARKGFGRQAVVVR